uniref:TetR/AcrR family transcriptional regulator n=1 Tax=Alteromonas australica TaxID=589873 RepID=UPI002491D7A2
LFAVRGFEGVSTTQIAKVAGITQPLIHYHFKNKEALWKATISRLFARLADEFEAEVRKLPRQDSRRYLIEMIRCYVAFVARYPQYGQFILREGVQESERLDWLVEEWLKPMLDRFQVVYEEGIADGWMKDIPFPQLIMMITASASQFFSMAPLVRALYDVDANCPEQTLAHSDAVVEVAVNAILRQPVTQQSEAAPV